MLFGILVLAYSVGISRTRRLGSGISLGAAENSLFAILGLLLAFAFSVSASRFDAKRVMSVDEANAIGTALLRVDLMPASRQPEMRRLFRRYLDTRLDYSRQLAEAGDLQAAWRATQDAQNQIWKVALDCPANPMGPLTAVQSLLIPALNQMFDLAASRHIASKTQLPLMTLMLLTALAIIGGYLAGRSNLSERDLTLSHRMLYPAVITLTLLVIIDLDYPRLGLIRLDYTDSLLKSLRAGLPGQ